MEKKDVKLQCIYLGPKMKVYGEEDNEDEEGYTLKQFSKGEVIFKLDHMHVTEGGKTEMKKAVVAKFKDVPYLVTLIEGEYKLIKAEDTEDKNSPVQA